MSARPYALELLISDEPNPHHLTARIVWKLHETRFCRRPQQLSPLSIAPAPPDWCSTLCHFLGYVEKTLSTAPQPENSIARLNSTYRFRRHHSFTFAHASSSSSHGFGLDGPVSPTLQLVHVARCQGVRSRTGKSGFEVADCACASARLRQIKPRSVNGYASRPLSVPLGSSPFHRIRICTRPQLSHVS